MSIEERLTFLEEDFYNLRHSFDDVVNAADNKNESLRTELYELRELTKQLEAQRDYWIARHDLCQSAVNRMIPVAKASQAIYKMWNVRSVKDLDLEPVELEFCEVMETFQKIVPQEEEER